jgi:hypothetical protein
VSKISTSAKYCCIWQHVTSVDLLSLLHSQETVGGFIFLKLEVLEEFLK